MKKDSRKRCEPPKNNKILHMARDTEKDIFARKHSFGKFCLYYYISGKVF